jgi:hypothetical protein
MPKKNSRSRSVDQRRYTPTQNPFENENARGGRSKGDEANRGGGPAKGEDNWHWSWSSPLRIVTMMGPPKSGGSLANVYLSRRPSVCACGHQGR